jgi:phage tail P2-like protein
MSATLRNLKLLDLCTQSISYDRQVQAATQSFDNQMHEIIDDTPVVIFISQILQLADSNLIDILAWQFHVDFYDHTKPLEFRRQLVFNSITWHMRKGTVSLVQEVLDTYFPKVATIQEWYQYMNPLPPNYPTDSPDTLVSTFGPTNVDVAGDRFLITAHGLTQNQQIRFHAGSLAAPMSIGGQLPSPIVDGIWYYVANPHTNDFQVSPSPWQGVPTTSGSVVNLTTPGSGSNNELWKRGAGTWHDRYKFRVLVDSQFIDPTDQQTVLTLIERYKPVSRWMDGFVRAQASECDIGWTGMLLRFIYRTSEAPDYP